ncbi:hypothetical protein Dsin_026110 [Dipteronia sinensis]|uniref:25S rRNA (uridine-N(3))-methyltransferase BMT5-like domain-containing protein n=1 Tax=Dipteronia sinensis TaxID=43782 RepID=A0AAD9ZXE8_9ROSI|nr:hypothetical protein Dsin_026110 [Dipteronia sinensis]
MGEVVGKEDHEIKWIKHYSSCQKILLVGEGDFSFAACLAKAFASASNITATSLDSKESLAWKYTRATSNLKELEELGCTMVHGVDANTMNQHPDLIFKSFDRIVYNFPHAGFIWKENNILQIELHRGLVKGFLRSARDMLKENGEVHVTHKTANPFTRWEIEKLAEEVGLRLVDKVLFYIWDYPGYENKRGDGSRCNVSFRVGDCCTFKFSRA